LDLETLEAIIAHATAQDERVAAFETELIKIADSLGLLGSCGVESICERAVDLAGQIAELEAERDGLRDKCYSAALQLTERSQEIGGLESDLATATARIAELQTERNNLCELLAPFVLAQMWADRNKATGRNEFHRDQAFALVRPSAFRKAHDCWVACGKAPPVCDDQRAPGPLPQPAQETDSAERLGEEIERHPIGGGGIRRG
jgi:hypothetical protein